ncbi:MAG TPA: BREX-1 system adenine-specific DNA-methyltransferase PglX, partial [Clostridia bacterium]|nr:BREX-1 system adenine-specific DNA-methyltransferase PglX [Clostridia bacterium]
MDKTALRNFAIYARNRLIQEIKNKVSRLGISADGIERPQSNNGDMYTFDIGGVEPTRIHGDDIEKYNRLVRELETRTKFSDYKTAYNGLIEEVAYTWFNRIIAIRFMEVNSYLPHRMRVLSSGREGVREPEFVTHYYEADLDLTDKELKDLDAWRADGSSTSMDNMFQLLFIKQCNALNDNLPELFEKTYDYAELLLTISYNDPDGVVYKLVHDIKEEYFNVDSNDGNGQVEIIGWLYQYYNTERKDEVFSRPGSAKIQKDDIPPATQLFTPDWIVRYMVENSLGRLWIEKLIASGDDRSEEEMAKEFGWEYYILEAEQTAEVTEKLRAIRKERKKLQLENIKFIDPAMGSFHIGIYAFEVFMQLYESQGYTARDASRLIIENNLYGIDIDKRAYQLSYFACMMKGRQYDRRILNREIKNNLYVIPESNGINRKHLQFLGRDIGNLGSRQKYIGEINEILDIFRDGREYGSILKVSNEYNFKSLGEFITSSRLDAQISIESEGIEHTQENLLEILSVAQLLAQKYDVVSTNPPYMGSRGMNAKLNKYVRDNYPDSKADLFAVFIEKCRGLSRINGFYAMITQHAWMFLTSYQKLRANLNTNTIYNMIHLGPRAFEEIGGEIVQTTSFVFVNAHITDYRGSYIRLTSFENAEEKKTRALEAAGNPSCGYYYKTNQNNFEKIPRMPVAYWASKNLINVFSRSSLLKKIGDTRQGMATSDNRRFLRLWHEVHETGIGFDCVDAEDSVETGKMWFPYNKGGYYRKWFGNIDFVINYENDGYEVKQYATKLYRTATRTIKSISEYFKSCISWSKVSGGDIAFRYYPHGFIFDVAGCCIFFDNKKYKNYVFAFSNSKVNKAILKILSPTLNYEAGDVASLPMIYSERELGGINLLVENNITISQTDWDSFETSWDFITHPFLDRSKQGQAPSTIESAYENWKGFANVNFARLKENEEELNRIFIEIYGLEDELTPEVSDKDITIAKIFDSKEEIYDDIKGNRYVLTKEDVIKSFISYGVGCIFGRYSVDVDGLAYAGGEWDDKKYKSFKPTSDNVILITDEDYYTEDITSKFIEFVKASFGADNLEENLGFIANALGGRGHSRDVIRNYFLKDFYKDHVRTYKKRPIYWLYNSGRQDGFKALIYMHRYNQDTTGKVRVDYLHELQRVYERNIENLREE